MKIKVLCFLCLLAFGISKSLAQSSSLFQRDNSLPLCEQIDRDKPPPPGPGPGGGGEEPTPLGSGIAILLGCATLYACTRRKKT